VFSERLPSQNRLKFSFTIRSNIINHRGDVGGSGKKKNGKKCKCFVLRGCGTVKYIVGARPRAVI
jgi:hypothetical protein